MLQSLTIPLAQIKGDNTSKNFQQVIYSLYRASKITKKFTTIKFIRYSYNKNGYYIFEF